MRILFKFLLLFMLTQVNSYAVGTEHLSGKEIFDMCQESKTIEEIQTGNFLHAGVCVGYILGIIDDEAFRAETDKKVNKLFCVPAETTRFQLVDVILDYFTKNPQAVNFRAASVVSAALQEAYPCTLA